MVTFNNMDRAATISPDGKYRYVLTRDMPFKPQREKRLLFVMLNPSTADGCKDDPTIRRCLGFMASGGFTGLSVVNLFAFRTSFPADLVKQDPVEIVGPSNDDYIRQEVERAFSVVCAWGANASYHVVKQRALQVIEIVKEIHGPMACLSTSSQGHPLHPLFVPAERGLEAWHGYSSAEETRCS